MCTWPLCPAAVPLRPSCIPLSDIPPLVNSFSPYPESAGLNPVQHYAAIQGPLHDYGSYIVSCKSTRPEHSCR